MQDMCVSKSSPAYIHDLTVTRRLKLLGTLTDDDNKVTIPHFCKTVPCASPETHLTTVLSDDSVRPLSDEEKQSYKVLSSVTQTPASLLAARWREPSLTVHNIEVSGPRSMYAVLLFSGPRKLI